MYIKLVHPLYATSMPGMIFSRNEINSILQNIMQNYIILQHFSHHGKYGEAADFFVAAITKCGLGSIIVATT
jgi:hypothetical protein